MVSAPLPKSCTISDINLLLLRKESYFLQCKSKCSSDSIMSGQNGQNQENRKQYEPRHEKICLRNFQSGPTQTELHSH